MNEPNWAQIFQAVGSLVAVCVAGAACWVAYKAQAAPSKAELVKQQHQTVADMMKLLTRMDRGLTDYISAYAVDGQSKPARDRYPALTRLGSKFSDLLKEREVYFSAAFSTKGRYLILDYTEFVMFVTNPEPETSGYIQKYDGYRKEWSDAVREFKATMRKELGVTSLIDSIRHTHEASLADIMRLSLPERQKLFAPLKQYKRVTTELIVAVYNKRKHNDDTRPVQGS